MRDQKKKTVPHAAAHEKKSTHKEKNLKRRANTTRFWLASAPGREETGLLAHLMNSKNELRRVELSENALSPKCKSRKSEGGSNSQ